MRGAVVSNISRSITHRIVGALIVMQRTQSLPLRLVRARVLEECIVGRHILVHEWGSLRRLAKEGAERRAPGASNGGEGARARQRLSFSADSGTVAAKAAISCG
jgi:hypothetical protein